jgi:ADP-L-glycero-D-manno-heptose 6-epimerase
VPTPESIRDKYQYFTEANMAKLRACGYGANMTPLEEGVRQYIQDYLATEDPFR